MSKFYLAVTNVTMGHRAKEVVLVAEMADGVTEEDVEQEVIKIIKRDRHLSDDCKFDVKLQYLTKEVYDKILKENRHE